MPVNGNKTTSKKSVCLLFLFLSVVVKEIHSDPARSEYDISATILETILERIIPMPTIKTPFHKNFKIIQNSQDLSQIPEKFFLPFNLLQNLGSINDDLLLNYFTINADSKGFHIQLVTGHEKINFSTGNIKLLGVVNNVEEQTLYISFTDESNSVNLIKSEYSQEFKLDRLPIERQNLNFQYILNSNKRPSIVKSNKYSFLMLDTVNDLYVSTIKESQRLNFKLLEKDIISHSECFYYKILDLNSYQTINEKFLIIGLVYHCADLVDEKIKIQMKFSNIFVDLSTTNLSQGGFLTNPRNKFKNIYALDTELQIDDDLSKLKTLFSQMKPDRKLANINLIEMKDDKTDYHFFFINLNNKIQIIQKFYYDENSKETFYHTFPHINLLSEAKTTSYTFSNEDLIILSIEENEAHLRIIKTENLFDLDYMSKRTEDTIRITLPNWFYDPFEESPTPDLEIKQLKNHFMIYNKNNITESVYVSKLYTE